MLIAGISRVEVGIGEPVLKAETLAGKFKVFRFTLKDDVDVVVGIYLGVISAGRFALICPTKNSATLYIPASGHTVTEFSVGILWELGQISDFVKGELITCLDTAKVEACIVHGLIDEASFSGLVALL